MNRFHSGVVRRIAGSALIAAATVLPGVFPRPAAAVEPGLGSVTIVQTNPANPSQAFHYTSNVPEMATDFYLDQDPTTYPDWSETSNWVTPGQFVVNQDEPPLGWDIGEISCTDPDGNSSGDIGNRSAQIRMDADEEIVCTFSMVQSVGDINIYQSTVPQSPTSFQYGGDFGSFSLSDDGDEVNDGTWRNQGFSGVWEGTYEVTQSALDGWDLTYLDCIDPDGGTNVDIAARKVTIDLDGGEIIDCTFTNQQPAVPTGEVNINLQTVPESPVDVAFTGDLGPFALDDDSGADATLENAINFALLTPGTKVVTVEAPDGWQLTDMVCIDPDEGTTDDATSMRIDLDAGETVNCVVQIEPLPPTPLPNQMNITLDSIPNDPVDVAFMLDVNHPFTLDDDSDGTLSNGKEFNDMDLGPWALVATVPSGWRIKDISCTDPDGGSTLDKAAASATLDLDNGETVNCTFTIEPIPQTPPPAPQPMCNGLPATIVGAPGATTIRGTQGPDVIVDLDGDNRIDGRGGYDTICTGNGNDVISGGAGDDVILAGSGANNVDGGAGNDVISGLVGNDNLAGGTGNDWIYAGEGTNSVSGGAGDDFLRAGSGNDRIDGGRNYDTYFPDGGTDVVKNCEA